ncbi:hypothetical protein [Mesorhizobium sp. ANAO-SY3R2]|uniref:type III secretion apparatus assembly protein SctX n=1 Tax=Mesorhizobium sp. ANAO-SY3R2 TaxID=3166644 RepID=UPI00366B18A7
MRIRNLDIGVERVTRWNLGDDLQLPREGTGLPVFLPQQAALDEVLRRPSLDERLPEVLQPTNLDPGLLDPSVMSQTRTELQQIFAQHAAAHDGETAVLFQSAADLLGVDAFFDRETRAALAMLLRG